MAELFDNLIETMGGGIKSYMGEGLTENADEDIGGSKRKNRETTESTKKVYLNNIIRLNNKQPIKYKKNGDPNYDFLKDTEKILERLNRLKPNSQRTYLISIVTTLRGLKQYETVYNFWYEKMMKVAEELKKGSNEKSESQKKNWMEQSEVNSVYERLSEKAIPLLSKRNAKITEQEWAIILDFVVLSLYCLMPPRRNRDYQLMLYVNDKNLIENTEFNYYLPKAKKFEFNQYKTSGTYNTQEVDVNPELVDILAKYVKLHPLNKGKDKQKNFYLLVNYKGEPLLAVNAITRILNKIFGKHVGASLLRNIYLSDKFKGHMEELDAITKSMGTSVRTSQDVYIKMDN